MSKAAVLDDADRSRSMSTPGGLRASSVDGASCDCYEPHGQRSDLQSCELRRQFTVGSDLGGNRIGRFPQEPGENRGLRPLILGKEAQVQAGARELVRVVEHPPARRIEV